MSAVLPADPEIRDVAATLQSLDADGTRTAQVLRNTIDQLYDGQRTGRFRWDQLYKTEKTHCGTLVEINLQKEFKFEDGALLDYRIAGFEVDCKYSQRNGSWMIPPEAKDHICLVVSAEDCANPVWSMGLIRARPEYLNAGTNRDAKATLNSKGRVSILWLHKNSPLPPNVLLQLDNAVVEKIMDQASGQKAVNELFRLAIGHRIGRAVIATVAQQDDYMKRVRENGGARDKLRAEGIVILGQYHSHILIAEALGISKPGRGESISVRLSPAEKPGIGVCEINGTFWRLSKHGDRIVAAPRLPATKRNNHPKKRRVIL